MAPNNDLPNYLFTDGNNNKYEIYKTKLNYIPVKKENSSSGIYSGGEPQKVEIDKSKYSAIEKLIKRVLKDKQYHLANRLMGCGTITSKQKTIFISRESIHLNNLEQYLKQIINNP